MSNVARMWVCFPRRPFPIFYPPISLQLRTLIVPHLRLCAYSYPSISPPYRSLVTEMRSYLASPICSFTYARHNNLTTSPCLPTPPTRSSIQSHLSPGQHVFLVRSFLWVSSFNTYGISSRVRCAAHSASSLCVVPRTAHLLCALCRAQRISFARCAAHIPSPLRVVPRTYHLLCALCRAQRISFARCAAHSVSPLRVVPRKAHLLCALCAAQRIFFVRCAAHSASILRVVPRTAHLLCALCRAHIISSPPSPARFPSSF